MTPEALDDEQEEQAANRVFPADRDPTAAELYSRALVHNVQNLPSLARFTIDTTRRLASLGGQALAQYRSDNDSGLLDSARALLGGDLDEAAAAHAAGDPFQRQGLGTPGFATAELSMAEFKQIRRTVPEATINDQFLCVVGGAVRAYLSAKKELPETTLLAMVPITLRGSDKGGEGNQVGATVIPVHTEIEDPMERLRAICRDAKSAKELSDKLGRELMRDLLQLVPSVIANPILRNAKLPWTQPRRVERARPRRAALHGRRTAHEVRAGQYRGRRHGPQRHWFQLRGHPAALHGFLPRDVAGSGFLRRLPARFLPADEGSGRTRSRRGYLETATANQAPATASQRPHAKARKEVRRHATDEDQACDARQAGTGEGQGDRTCQAERQDPPGRDHGSLKGGPRGGRPVGGERWSTVNVECVPAIACRPI